MKAFKIRIRHYLLTLSLIIVVLLPKGLVGYYLYYNAKDQFVSTVAFTVRAEDTRSVSDMLGGLSALGSVSSKDSDILNEYINSKSIVASIESTMDLKSMYSMYYNEDPIFSFNPKGSIEDLTKYWNRMVKIYYDQGTSLLEVQVRAFNPIHALELANKIFEESTKIVNELNAIAREDSIRYSKEELERAQQTLLQARIAVTEFRTKNQILDPESEIGIQVGVISALQTKLSDLLIESDLLNDVNNLDDPRQEEIELTVEIIKSRIEEERAKYSDTLGSKLNYSSLVSKFQSLNVEQSYAEQAYIAARAAYDAAQLEATRKSRYLAAYIKPTLAETAEHPQRLTLFLIVSLFLWFSWSSGVLIFYAIKDRR